MRSIWSEIGKRRTWRRVWAAVAEAQARAGLVSPEQVAEIKSHINDVDLKRALEFESQIGHDLMAELKTFAEQCPTAGRILHWGMTSADVQENADVVRQRGSLTILLGHLRRLLLQFAERIEATADLTVLAYTHLQPAEPTTLGYRLTIYAQDLMGHYRTLARVRMGLRGKGIKGAVGTYGPFVEMLGGTGMNPQDLEASVMRALEIEAYPAATQTYPRIQDYTLITALAGLAASLHKFAFDLRLMQSPGIRTAAEPIGEVQVGSSSMPFKRNPVLAENICSLARQVAAGAEVAWQNAASALLERTLDDSANRRSLIPEAFLGCEEMLIKTTHIIKGMSIDHEGIARWTGEFGVFAGTERLLTALVRAGADRQEMHELLRQHSMLAWEAVKRGEPNPLASSLAGDEVILQHIEGERIGELLKVEGYVGLAPQRAREQANRIRALFTGQRQP